MILRSLNMKVQFDFKVLEDYGQWALTNKKIFKKIRDLIKYITRTPYEGIGRPEQLKHNFSGYWSRRIDSEHRLIYAVDDDVLHIISCKHHYSD